MQLTTALSVSVVASAPVAPSRPKNAMPVACWVASHRILPSFHSSVSMVVLQLHG